MNVSGLRSPFAVSLLCIALTGCVAPPNVSQAQLDDAARTGICCVHHIAMKQTVTAIRYGFIVAPKGIERPIERSTFPFAQRHVFGGCTLGPPWTAQILVCDQCTAAKVGWIERHPRDPWSDWWKQDMAKPHPETLRHHSPAQNASDKPERTPSN